jgi:hypothetical protein
MITSYQILSLTPNGVVVEYQDAGADIKRRINLLPPFDAAGTLLTGDALKRHIIEYAPVKEMEADATAKANAALLPIGVSTAITQSEITAIRGNT